MDLEREGRGMHGIRGFEPRLVDLLARDFERGLSPDHRSCPSARHGVYRQRWRDLCARREARHGDGFRVYPPRSAGGTLCESRSRRQVYVDQGDHLRSAPRRGGDARAVGGARGCITAFKSLCAAGAASGLWRRGEYSAGGGFCGAQGSAGVEEPMVAGDGLKLRFQPRELWVRGRERRLARSDAKLQDGLGVWLGYEWQRS